MSKIFHAINTRALGWALLAAITLSTLLAGCSGPTYKDLDKAAIDTAVMETTGAMLAAAKAQDMDALAATRREPNGTPIDIKQVGCAVKQNHAFFDYDGWEVLSAGADASGKDYKINARLNFNDGQHNDVIMFLHQFDDGWQVVKLLPDFHFWCP